MLHLFLVLAVMTGGYYLIRYYLIRHALQDADKNLREIRTDISQNRILHLPLPDRNLEKLMDTINDTLAEVRRERLSYEKREKEFQAQIENISHDLRTPLTVILGYLRFMKDQDITDNNKDCINSDNSKDWDKSDGNKDQVKSDGNKDRVKSDGNKDQVKSDGNKDQVKSNSNMTDQVEILEIIERKAMSMEKLVAQFYAFSRLYAGDYELALQNVDICRIVRETLADSYQVLEAAHLTVDTDLAAHPVWVKGEAEALERILSNLYQNAGRYAKSFLCIILEEKDNEVSLLFINDTERIPEQDISRLFDRFYTGDHSRSPGNTGLGLTVAKSLAQAMDGDLQAHVLSDGDNICFTLVLHRIHSQI